MLGLDAISRNLFGTSSSNHSHSSSNGLGGGSSLSSRSGSTSHKRSRSANSKTSTMSSSLTQSTVSSFGRTSDEGGGDGGIGSGGGGVGDARSRSGSLSPYHEKRASTTSTASSSRKPVPMEGLLNDSEWDLSQKLELARKNSVVAGSSAREMRREKSMDKERSSEFAMLSFSFPNSSLGIFCLQYEECCAFLSSNAHHTASHCLLCLLRSCLSF